MSEICVVHLVWIPLGPAPLERFAASYRRHRAGRDHRLVVLYNGLDAGSLDPWEDALAGIEHERLFAPRTLVDMAAYRFAAQAVDCDAILFLNSYSEILEEGWLEKLWRGLERDGVGLVGATGSHESLVPPSGSLRLLQRPWFDPFPNPHVRTSAFMLRRDTALALDWPRVRTKWGAWRLENGRRSVTRQVQARGLEALVVGRDGDAYEKDRWYDSRTFRSGGQENLLVADNRTRQFAEADPAEQRRLAELAWGPRS
jgi:hypothetical protein